MDNLNCLYQWWVLQLISCWFLVVFFSCVLQYRQAYTGNNPSQVQTAMDGFEDVIRRFPKCAEGYALYAQVQNQKHDFSFYTSLDALAIICSAHLQYVKKISYRPCWFARCAQHAQHICVFFQALTDQQQFGKADEMYDKCIELEPDNATTYVHKG